MQGIIASFISTSLNEEKNIEKFLRSLLSNTLLPSEIILVDAYSKDKTYEIFKRFQEENKEKLKIKIFQKKGNRSVGRNEAIKNAKGDIIICSDIGCSLDKNYIKRILDPFKERNVDVASGFYRPIANTVFEKCLASYTSVMPDKIDPQNFLPSSRSVAFKKELWERVNGYPEHLDTCEDLIFDIKLKKSGARFEFNKDAIVYWPQRKNLLEAFSQFFSYAYGDGMAHYFRKQIPFLYTRYFLGLIIFYFAISLKSYFLTYSLLTLFILYLIWSIWKNFRYVRKLEAILILPILQLTSDIAVIVGTTSGFIRSIWVTQKML